MASIQNSTVQPVNTQAAIVDALRQRFGQQTAVWIGSYKDTKFDWQPGEDKRRDYFGLAVRHSADEPWQHLGRRVTLHGLLKLAQTVRL